MTGEAVAILGPMEMPAIDGLTVRSFTDATDYEAIAAVIEAAHLADGDEYLPDAPSLQVEFEHRPGFDPRRDFLFAEVAGRTIAYGEVLRQVRDEVAVYTTLGAVHPDFRRRGLGRAILHQNEARLREIARTHSDPGGHVYGSWCGDRELGARALLLSEGYAPVRYGLAMIRSNLDDLPDAPLPEGLDIRPVRPEDHRRIFEADNEAFRDHWGHQEQTDDDFAALYAYPDLDTSLWRVAWDGDEVAGSVMTFIWKSENEKLGVNRGWFEHISVRRPWRRRGLARALIVSAMEGLRDADYDAAMLGVDAENKSGALRMYEALGFTVKDSGTHYRKEW